ncbi:hypothetical protein A9F13_02g00473 [Clavispora lusitaniae]|uniref:Uncharacterized protein n=1 Tax=Clavispora lusitaniae TaxID=36911 RepID=A0AA91Q2V1_CLALS|nr:hypothetical protein A9F13_02g00473 [Clavispora lusitaniae]
MDAIDKIDESDKTDAIDKIDESDKVGQAASQTVSDPNTKSREITENAPSETGAGDAPNGERAGRRKKNKKKKAAVSSSSEEDFVDSASSLPSRRPSRSKQFKQKMDTDLENTIEMLKESIAE